MTALFSALRSHMLGAPDGVLTRLRCALLGHAWEGCYDECCAGEMCWCRRCHANDLHLRCALAKGSQ